jgi:hypothetical protein
MLVATSKGSRQASQGGIAMFEHLRAYTTRPTFFLAAGMAIGALLAPAFGGGGAQAVTYYTRAASCAGVHFYPTDSGTTYGVTNSLRSGPNTSDVVGTFTCDPSLPNGAIVTKLQVTASLVLASPGVARGVSLCVLVRTALSPANLSFQQVASVAFLDLSVAGVYRRSTTAIAHATIDNAQFAYELSCTLDYGNENAGIWGADVIYKITAAKG